jgi:hypothetical protein
MKSFLKRLHKLQKGRAEKIGFLSLRIEFIDAATKSVTNTLLLQGGSQRWTRGEVDE